MGPAELPPLRRRTRRLNFAQVASRMSPGIREVMDTVEPFAAAWDADNRAELAAEGPLWIALGDSSAQGVGATTHDRGFVGLVRRRLRESTSQPWRVINLSMSGGRFADVIDRQIPLAERLGLQPDLVTCVVGSNDVIWRLRTRPVLDDARRFVRALPLRTVLSLVAHTRNNRQRRAAVNEILEDESPGRELHTLQIWKSPAPEGSLAADKFHPSDLGYQHMADRLWGTITEANLIEQESDHRPR
jgi:lysophospholipase L1-like esterase